MRNGRGRPPSAPPSAAATPGSPPPSATCWSRPGACSTIVGSSEYEQERHTALRQALRKLRDLERRTGWQLPSPAALALEQRARGVLGCLLDPYQRGKPDLSAAG